MLPPIIIREINPSLQRYETVGDWENPPYEGAAATITVSSTGNEQYSFLLAIHELVEWYLCRAFNVTQEEVDKFDKEWEESHAELSISKRNYSEPGDDPDAPYHRHHMIASVVEQVVAHELGIDFHGKYAEAINKAYYKTKRALKKRLAAAQPPTEF